jgi:DNA-binding response OmpR family regulator
VVKSPVIPGSFLVKKGHILHVEDDDNDVFFLTLAAEDAGITNAIEVARDGRQAIDYLKLALARSDYTPAALPCLALLDVKLPLVTGIDVLRWIRQQPALHKIPILMFSALDQSSDLRLSYQCGADSYFVKPGNLTERTAFARRLKSWILDQGELPCSPGWRANCISAGVSFLAKKAGLEPRMDANKRD